VIKYTATAQKFTNLDTPFHISKRRNLALHGCLCNRISTETFWAPRRRFLQAIAETHYGYHRIGSWYCMVLVGRYEIINTGIYLRNQGHMEVKCVSLDDTKGWIAPGKLARSNSWYMRTHLFGSLGSLNGWWRVRKDGARNGVFSYKIDGKNETAEVLPF
jgi:hypothetical protein